MNNKIHIKLIQDDQMSWDWDGSQPHYYTKTPNSKYGGIYNKFDPFPCYHHLEDLVLEEAKKAATIFPIEFETFYFIFKFESISRTNGCAYTNTIEYEDEKNNKKSTWDGVINLYGKRIPLHPAMTRYLVNHEYSHLIDNWICRQRGLQFDGMDEEYAKLRNIECDAKYGGRNWDTNIGEIIANDIRIVLFNSEIEFWPHPCEHPLKNKKIIKFWTQMKEKYKYKNK